MSETITVRSCLNLPGLRYGEIAEVDPEDPYIAGLLKAQFLAPLDAAEPKAEAAPPASIEEPVGWSHDAGED